MNDEFTRDEAAADWALQRAEGLSSVQAEELQAWLAADPLNAQALREAELTQQLFGLLRDPATKSDAPSRGRTFSKVVAFGAVALAAAAAVVFLVLPRAVPEPSDVVRLAATSEPLQQLLPDGSTITLNTSGVAAIQLTSSKRSVVLEGEGYFNVRPEENRPFSVEADGWIVTAVGTAFTVAAERRGEVKVVVTEGVVAIARKDGTLEPRRVAAGESARMRADLQIPAVAPTASEDLRAPLAWLAKVETFEAVTLGELVARFNRTGRVRLSIADQELYARKIGGTFSTDNLDAFLALLRIDGGILVERVSADEIRLRAARN